MTAFDADVAVIGAGPAGSVLAGSVAERGPTVTVFEKSTFPRFHIGESLLPMTEPHFRAFGVDLDDADYAIPKHGAVFYEADTDQIEPIPFARTRQGTPSHAHQVLRADLDHALAEQAGRLGAEILFDCEVTGWQKDDSGVDVQLDGNRTFRCRYLVDATGRRAMMGRRNNTIHRIDAFGQIATYTHYKNVPHDRFPPCMKKGEIMIALLDDSWLWCIPLAEQRVSLGVVERSPDSSRSPQTTIRAALDRISPLRDVASTGVSVNGIRQCAGYSYINQQPFTRRTICVGDAYVFLDPIFSTAIHRAVSSARRLADVIDDAVTSGTHLNAEPYFRWVDRAHRVYGRLMSRFYNRNWVRNMFFSDDRPDGIVDDVTRILAGDVWWDDNTFLNLLLRGDEDVFPSRSSGTTS